MVTQDNMIQFVLNKDEIVLNVQQRAWLIAKSAAEKENYDEHKGKWLADIFHGTCEDSGRIDVPSRWIELAYGKVATILSGYVEPASHNMLFHDMQSHAEHYAFDITYPYGMTYVQGKYINSLMFEYIVVYVLWKWCLEVATEFAESIYMELSEAEKELLKAVNGLSKTGERKMFPF